MDLICILRFIVYVFYKTLRNETSHFMITNPWTFSFPDAVHFNFHLALTLNPIPVFFILSERETPQ